MDEEAYIENIMRGAARGDQLWHFAKQSSRRDDIMRNNLQRALTEKEYIRSQWRDINAQIDSLKRHMREAGIADDTGENI